MQRGAAGALGREAARSLRFARPLRDVAVRIRQDVTGGSEVPLNGVHLRLERDAVAAWLGHTNQEVSWLSHLIHDHLLRLSDVDGSLLVAGLPSPMLCPAPHHRQTIVLTVQDRCVSIMINAQSMPIKGLLLSRRCGQTT